MSDRVPYIVFRGRRCSIVVWSTHAASKETHVDSKESFYEELQQVFCHFPKYRIKNLLEDFNKKLEREREYF